MATGAQLVYVFFSRGNIGKFFGEWLVEDLCGKTFLEEGGNFSRERMFVGTFRGRCRNSHAGLPVLRVAVVIWTTLLAHTQTNRQTERRNERMKQTDKNSNSF